MAATASKRSSGTDSAARVKAPPRRSMSNLGPKRVGVPPSSRAPTRWRRVAASLCSSPARASQGRRTGGRPCRATFIRRRAGSSMGAYLVDGGGEAAAALREGAGAEQQLGRPLAQAQVGEQRLDVPAHAVPFATVHHAEQVVGPVGQAARAAVAEVDARRAGQLAA